jgi:hypothetical protein
MTENIMRMSVGVIIAITLVLPARADNVLDPTSCANIKESVKRLDCYDLQSKKSTKKENRKGSIEDDKRAVALRAAQEEERARQEAEKASVQAEQELAKAEAAARDALKSLRRLQAKVQTGISYRDYSPALADAKLDVSLFAESASAKKFPEFANLISQAIKHYDIANGLWKIKFAERYAWLTDQDATQSLMAMYPEIARSKQTGVNLHIEESVMMIWRAASKDIEQATKLLAP